jgi:hypothetical protein
LIRAGDGVWVLFLQLLPSKWRLSRTFTL